MIKMLMIEIREFITRGVTDVTSSAAVHGAGSQVSSQSLSSPLGLTHLPQQSQYSGTSAHN
jgi:hypothetical protein